MKKQILLGLALLTLAFPNITKAEDSAEKKAYNNLTNIYANGIYENLNLANNLDDNLKFDHEIKNRFYFDTHHDTNFMSRKGVSPFHKYTTINELGINLEIIEDIVVGLAGHYSKQINSHKDGSYFNADEVGGSIAVSRIVKDFNNITNKLTLSYNDAKVVSPVATGKNDANEYEKAIIAQIDSSYTHTFNIEKIKTRIKPFVANHINIVVAYNSKTENLGETTHKDKYAIGHDYISAGLQVENGINDTINLTNRIRVGGIIPIGFFERTGKLNGNTENSQPTELDKFNIDYTIKVNAAVNKYVNFDAKANIDARLRFGLSGTLNVVF